jgi:aldehyde dehydrogenase (NAD+)
MIIDETHHESLYIGGQWRKPAGSARTNLHSASTGAPVGSVPTATHADVDAAVAAARRAFDDPGGWSTWDPERRAAALERFAVQLKARGDQIARRVSMQNGMPISTAIGMEAALPPLLLDYYATLIRKTPSEETRDALLGGTTIVRKKPLGVIGLIVPWNFPQVLTSFKLAPALAAGNTVVVKPPPRRCSTPTSSQRPRTPQVFQTVW